MRVNYWSCSEFADNLRTLLGVPILPKFATREGWDEYKKSCQAMLVRNWSIDQLDTLQNIINWIPDRIKSVGYFFSNIRCKSHVLRTQTKFGQWSDLTSRIPDGLMYAIIDFVEQECFWMTVMCSPQKYGKDIENYVNQSYIRRKLFPIKISDTKRAELGLEWLEWQKSHLRDEDKHVYDEIIAAYKFAKNRYFKFDLYEESGFNDTVIVYGLTRRMNSDLYDRMNKLEEFHSQETTLHCTNIVRHHEYLWT